jgi:alkylated DNA nucleotide flippase Atl1
VTDVDDYVEAVLSCVERIPSGRVTTYGAIAEVVGGGPRQVGSVMARHGGPVPWWRVVRADGSLPDSHLGEAKRRYTEEGTPRRASGAVDIREAFWDPDPDFTEVQPAPPAGPGRAGRSRPAG